MMAASPLPGAVQARDCEVPLWRLYLLRAMFLVFAVGGCFVHLPWLFDDPDLTRRGMIDAMLVGLWLMSFFGLRYPLQMLPIFLFEFAWKTVWLLAFGLPQWMAARDDPQLREDLWMIGLGPLVFGLIIPWGWVWRHYFKQPSERWRIGTSPAMPSSIATDGASRSIISREASPKKV